MPRSSARHSPGRCPISSEGFHRGGWVPCASLALYLKLLRNVVSIRCKTIGRAILITGDETLGPCRQARVGVLGMRPADSRRGSFHSSGVYCTGTSSARVSRGKASSPFYAEIDSTNPKGKFQFAARLAEFEYRYTAFERASLIQCTFEDGLVFYGPAKKSRQSHRALAGTWLDVCRR